jgi:hypothetical protein
MANECIPLYRPGADITAIVGSGGVTGKTFVDISAALSASAGTDPTVVTATAAGAVVGVASRDAIATAKVVVLRNKGAIVPVTAGGNIAVGAKVEVGTGGKAVTIASGIAVGRAWTAGTNNNDVFVELY